MRRTHSGFTLLEVLVALLVITVALLGLLGTLGPIAALSGEGRHRGRAALALASRADRLRADILAAAPACLAPSAGSRRHPDGFAESWRATSLGTGIELTVIAGRDTLVTRVACP
jgi:prepilin-type N-terminal cleavage/methylation domain-containing protein